jgi:hypothetical protein
MIACVQVHGAKVPCVVYWTGRIGLSVKTRTWCGGKHDAGDGVIQIPDDAKICEKCESFIETGKPNV